jgi:plastocyanin
MNRRTLVRMIGGAAAVPVLAGCTVLDALDENRANVDITADSRFQPGGITINAGDTIVWRSMHSRPHVISTDPAEFEDDVPVQVPDGAQPFTSPELVLNDRFTHQFDVPGEYIYACPIHPEMIGTVTVLG